jgi:hypothetical protein
MSRFLALEHCEEHLLKGTLTDRDAALHEQARWLRRMCWAPAGAAARLLAYAQQASTRASRPLHRSSRRTLPRAAAAAPAAVAATAPRCPTRMPLRMCTLRRECYRLLVQVCWRGDRVVPPETCSMGPGPPTLATLLVQAGPTVPSAVSPALSAAPDPLLEDGPMSITSSFQQRMLLAAGAAEPGEEDAEQAADRSPRSKVVTYVSASPETTTPGRLQHGFTASAEVFILLHSLCHSGCWKGSRSVGHRSAKQPFTGAFSASARHPVFAAPSLVCG